MKTPSIQVNVLESSQSWNVTALSPVNRNAFTSKPHFRSVHGGQDQKTLLSVRSFHLMTSDLSHVLSPLLKCIWKIHWKTPTTVFLLQEFLGKVMAEYSRSMCTVWAGFLITWWSQTWVEVTSRVEGSAVDGGRESVTADGLGDVCIEVPVKPENTLKKGVRIKVPAHSLGAALVHIFISNKSYEFTRSTLTSLLKEKSIQLSLV